MTHPKCVKADQVDHLHPPWLRGEGDRLEDPGAASPWARHQTLEVGVCCIIQGTRDQEGDVQGRSSSRESWQVDMQDCVRVYLGRM